MVTLMNTGLFWRQHKTQNTTHTDITTNKMSQANLPSRGFAPSLSMGRAVAPPNHGATAPHHHAQALSRRISARCHWFARLGRQNKRHQIRERGGVGCLGLRWPPFYQYKQQSNGRRCRRERVRWRRGKAGSERVGRTAARHLGWDINRQKK